MLLYHRKRAQYHMKIFRRYYKLIFVVHGGRRASGGHRNVKYFTFRAQHSRHDALITELPNYVKGWKSA